MILNHNDDGKIARDFGIYKTLKRVKHNYYWHRMEQDVKDYVPECDICQQDLPSCYRLYGQLECMEVPYQLWSSISMDWIVDLPVSICYTEICVIVDRFLLKAYLIPLPTKVSAKDIVKKFLNKISTTHGFPMDILSNREL